MNFSLRGAGLGARLVIQRNTVEYLAPIQGEFEAHCPGLTAAQFSSFVRMLERHGKTRATLTAVISFRGEKAATFSGDYVAVR